MPASIHKDTSNNIRKSVSFIKEEKTIIEISIPEIVKKILHETEMHSLVKNDVLSKLSKILSIIYFFLLNNY